MHISLNIRHFAAEPEQLANIGNFARDRASFALNRFAPRIKHLVLSLDDTNGPRGGVSIAGRALLTLDCGRQVVITALGTSPITTIAKLIGRLPENIRRTLDRARSWR